MSDYNFLSKEKKGHGTEKQQRSAQHSSSFLPFYQMNYLYDPLRFNTT